MVRLGLGYASLGCAVGDPVGVRTTDGGEERDSEAERDASHDDDAASAAPDASDEGASEVADAGSDAGVPSARFESRRLTSPPSYMGSVNNGSACSQSYVTQGF